MRAEPRRESLRSLIEPPVAGFWGQAECSAACPVAGRVIRNADVPESRVIDTEDLPLRWFARREIDKAEVTARDVVLVSSGYIGKSGRVGDRTGDTPIVASNFVRRLRPRSGVEPDWLYYLLGSSQAVSAMLRNSGGTTIANLSQGYLDDFVVEFVPGTEEQRRIAEILNSIDESIRRTEQVIIKLREMRKGLLHDLLTCGINENGELRDAERHREHFKDSPLGRVPNSWEVRAARFLCSDVVDCPHSTPEYVPQGVPAIRTADIVAGALRIEQALRVDATTYRLRTARLEPRSGDVLYSREGGRLGIAGIVGDAKVCMAQRVMLLRPAAGTDPVYFVWALNSVPFVRQVIARVGASASPHVNVADIAGFLVPCPPRAEQQAIGAVLRAHDTRMEAQERETTKLRCIKRGLMDDLLSGHVRAPTLYEASA